MKVKREDTGVTEVTQINMKGAGDKTYSKESLLQKGSFYPETILK